ncbi:MAG: sugar ABC transporter permease [Acholeplasmataceae bacterium]|nr:sugar ABC transporter permease [Acholeplasmataceae bacterium]
MKLFSILKAIASGLIWGLGQLLNGQFFKFLFFFVFFVLFVGIEFTTSHYQDDINAYDKIVGKDFGDEWYLNGFLAEYNYNKLVDGTQYDDFEDFIVEIGGQANLTEELFIQFFAQDLKNNNPIRYTNLQTNQDILVDDFNASFDEENKVHLLRKQTLYKDDLGVYYKERNVTQEDGSNKKEFIETTVLTDELNENNILSANTDLTLFVKSGEIYTADSKFYVKVMDDGLTKYVDLQTNEVVTLTSAPTSVKVEGPIYELDGNIYEYYEPNLIYNSKRIQYKETDFSITFRQAMSYTFSYAWNTYTGVDYTKLMIKVYHELNPDVRDNFIESYDNFFYDQGGLFVRGYWAVVTLGTAKKVSISGHMGLMDSMIGNRDSQFSLLSTVTISDPVPIQGHVSTLLLLEGLIGVILSFFFFIIMIWNIRDAYRTSEKKRLKQKVLKDGAYFKNVYEESFEYIVLSPAIFVLGFISIMPIAFGFVIAFTNISGNESMLDTFDWVGLTNFIAIFNFNTGLGASFGLAFWRVLSWTVVWAVLSTGTVFFGGFIQALILNSEKVVFRKLWRTILILPWAIPALLSQMVFSVMFNEVGFVNTFMQEIGIYEILRNLKMLGVSYDSLTGFSKLLYLGESNIQWFSNPFNPTFVRATLIVVNIWLGFPYFMALMTGVMTAIDKTLYEAADIDGASGMQKITKITMPLVLYSTAPILIMTFSGNFNNFGVIYFITGGGPNAGIASRGFAGDTDILISWMYTLTVDYSIFNMASVFSVLIFLFVGSLTAWNLSRTRAFMED